MADTSLRRPAVAMGRVLAAKWTKLMSLRSSVWVGLGTVAAAAGLAAALGMFGGRSSAASVVSGYPLAQLGSLVLGVLVGTGEYTAGTFRSTFTAVPRRLPVLGAQVVVTTGLALTTAVASLVTALVLTSGQRAVGLTLDGETVRLLVGFVLCLTGVALLGLGIGALLRRPTGALVAAAMLLVVVDRVLETNPGRVTDTVRAFLPGSAARVLQDDSRWTALDATTLGPHLGPWVSVLVLGLWVAALLGAAAYRLRRHDLT